ncbi:MAG: hypothetical protein HC836_42175 [Richelia sp. RM2_1_2]|nr:hypothetical protein [Richelia sp. RM1_1_1]NJO64520.1 hypothetical protein [Richelia sp. RM2_1_2]
MISTNLKLFQNLLFTGALGIMSLSYLLIDSKPSLAANQSPYPCSKSVPDPNPIVGVLSFSILGGGYLIKQRLREKGDCLNKNDLLPINDVSPSLEFQIIDPTKVI